MRVLMAASEVAPYAKSGGLADVLGALPAALGRCGPVEPAVLLPCYRGISLEGAERVYHALPVWVGGFHYDCALWRTGGDSPVYLLDCPPLFDRPGLYGENGADYPDNHARFAVFSRAVLEVARRVFRPDVIHCHDWQTGLVPAYLRGRWGMDPTFLGIKTVLTIHNLGYQGVFPASVLPQTGLDSVQYHPDGAEYWGQVSYLKAGIVYSDAITTVSHSYAEEIQTPEYGLGLDGVLRNRRDALTGILNGVDYGTWDPRHDPSIAAPYSAGDLAGKAACKRDLLRSFGLGAEAEKRPLLGVVTRLTPQKGSELILEIAGQLAAEGATLVVLGSGDPDLERDFQKAARASAGALAVRIGYDDGLAHRIEAGSDMFLMPSRYEPCGLSQIYSLRYGTVPVVRVTGGLGDTIDEETGFRFSEYSAAALLACVREALQAYRDRESWTARMKRGMAKDFSWDRSAAGYVRLYESLVRSR
ncbi:MAG: glycogen synthase GlgA [Bryobacterales bacterium]|nr:glycogen synthase GlgA [Bryobacterales bacterium]